MKEELNQLCGWAVREWSLLPGRLLTLDLINFHAHALVAKGHRLAKLSFVGPTEINFENIRRDYGQEIEIEHVLVEPFTHDSEKFVIGVSRRGKMVIVAREITFIFFD